MAILSWRVRPDAVGKWIARIGTVLALGFLAVVLVRGLSELPVLDWTSGRLWGGLVAGLVIYVVAQLIGAAAWRGVLRIYDADLAIGCAESQLLVSQIGKYIPGNVAHLFGRLGLARADGVLGGVAGAAMLLEVAMLLTAGAVIVGVVLVLQPALIIQLTAEVPQTRVPYMVGFGVVVVFITLLIGQIIIWRKAGRPQPTVQKWVAPFALHLVNFAVLGGSLWCVAGAISPSGVPILHCVVVFTTAWVLGFLMPGAPGGIGVRDGIIAIGLGLFLGQGVGLGIAVAHRLMSVVGDAVAFGIGVLIRRWSDVQE